MLPSGAATMSQISINLAAADYVEKHTLAESLSKMRA